MEWATRAMTRTAVVRYRAPRIWSVAIVGALVLSLAFTQVVFAEAAYYEGNAITVQTAGWYSTPFYLGWGYSNSQWANDYGVTDFRGYNNGGGWHLTAADACWI